MANIHYLDDNNQPQVVEVNQDSGDVFVGRASDCQIRTAGHSVSRKHARLGWQDGLYVLEDLGSSNGTFYFTDRLDPNVPVILEDGVIFRCGAFELRFEREAADTTLEQPFDYPEEGIPPPPFEIPPPPTGTPPPPLDLPPPPPPPPPPRPSSRPESSIENASTSGFAVSGDREVDVQIRVSAAQSAVVTEAPDLWSPRDEPTADEEPDAEPVFDDDLPVESPVVQLEPQAESELESAAATADPGVAVTSAEVARLADELAASQDEVEARTALWRQALADLSVAHEATEAEQARADALQFEHDRVQADFAAADSARRELAARLDLLEGQHAAAEQALLAELTAARAGRPSPAADGDTQLLRQELAAAQAALRGLDDQAEAEAVELRRQLTEALAENERLSALLDAASLPTTPLRQDATGDDDERPAAE